MESAQNFINDEQWDDCVTKADAMLKTEPRVYPFVLRARGHRCHCYSKVGRASGPCFGAFVLKYNLYCTCDCIDNSSEFLSFEV